MMFVFLKPRLWFAPVLILLFLTGCVTPQIHIDLDQKIWSEKKTLGIYISTPEKADFFIEGNVGLLDMAVIAVATDGLQDHIDTLNGDDFEHVFSVIENKLKESNQPIKIKKLKKVAIDKKLIKEIKGNLKGEAFYFKTDLTPLKKKLDVDYLLCFKVVRMGVARGYYGFIPTSEPRAVFNVNGALIDLNDNKMMWYGSIAESSFSSGEWDESPTYPGLTSSYYNALEGAKQKILADLHSVIKKDNGEQEIELKPEVESGVNKQVSNPKVVDKVES